MKKILFTLIGFPVVLFAQTAIGKTSVSNNSVSLEFGNGNRGLILPYATTPNLDGAVPGTVMFDVSSGIVKFKSDTGVWNDLSKNVQNVTYGGTTIADTTGRADTSLQSGFADVPSQKAIIGNIGGGNSLPGALVLAETNKAMILPKVASPHLNIINPAPGMLVYDTVTNQLAVFNGTVWSFWRP